MVKADLTRDYYGDLDLHPGADAQEIKKQFKKLALTYHPDRNPGRESEVTAKFQKIQSAHEVLTDTSERAKYDANRIRTPYKPSYTGGTSSGVRGNPWSNAGSQWAPPPKPPTARNRPPPPSAGARRYDKFDAPKTSSSHQAYEGAEARRGTYEAWEHMKAPKASQSRPVPKPPRADFPKPKADYRKPTPKPAYEEFKDSTPDSSPHRRSASTNASARKGFMPNTPGGDEPAASKGAYFTTRTAPPEPPPRNHMAGEPYQARPDPLRKFRDGEVDDGALPNLEKRYTPYATHGGEKFNPFEDTNINRSKSTRVPSSKTGPKNIFKAGSDPNLASSRQPRSATIDSEEDSDSELSDIEDNTMPPPRTSGHAFGKSRASTRRSNGTAPPPAQQVPNATQASTPSRKQKSKLARFQQWRRENPGKTPDVDSWEPDGPPLRSDEQNAQPDKDKMYGSSAYSFFDKKRTHSVKPPTVSDNSSAKTPNVPPRQSSYRLDFEQYPNLFQTGNAENATPSGVASEPHHLNDFEKRQRNLVDQLLSTKSNGSSSQKSGDPRKNSGYQNGKHSMNGNSSRSPDKWQHYRDPLDVESPSKNSKPAKHLHSVHSRPISKARSFYPAYTNANYVNQSCSFTFPVENDTFKRTQPTRNGFTSNSAENISTKFAAEDWAGKFEAGANMFKPDPKAAGPSARGRAQSASRSRGRSPIKVSTAPRFAPSTEPEPAMESPGGTKFSAEEWAQYFKPGKPGLFAPAPSAAPRTTPRKRASVPRPTMGGKAAVVDDSEASDEKPLYDAKPAGSSTPFAPSPDAMDVDSPPTNNTVPQFAERRNSAKENLKRPATTSQSQSPTDTEGLKVNFDDMKIQDLISFLNLPTPPLCPTTPKIPTQYERPNRTLHDNYKKDFAKYMQEWDLFNNKYLLHLVARKNQQIDPLGSSRWDSDEGMDFYRRVLREDAVVLKHWQDAREVHEGAMKEFVVLRERMKTREEMATPSPRKKTH